MEVGSSDGMRPNVGAAAALVRAIGYAGAWRQLARRADVPPFEMMRRTLWLGEGPVETDPRMRRIADIRPAIERLSRTYGDRGIVWALAAIIVHMAVEAEDEQVVAAILRTNARLLELENGADPLGLGP